MTTKTFKSPPRQPEKLLSEPLEVPAPRELKEQVKGPWWQRLLMPMMLLMVVGMFAVMIMSGQRQFNPMMLMMPMMFLMSTLGYMGVGGAGGGSLAEIDVDRKSYFLELREQRKTVHDRARIIHNLQVRNFPNPKSLASLVGQETMWQANSSQQSKSSDSGGEAPPPPLSPYLMARMGVGIIKMYPQLKRADIQIPENTEPVTTIAHTRFYRNQNFIANTPVGASMHDAPVFSFQGDAKMISGLGRAMITSLAYNHSPKTIALGIVSENIDDPEWSWMKWLPHNQDPVRRDTIGSARLAWKSLDDFAHQMSPMISERGGWVPDRGGESPFYIIFVDAPGKTVSLPDPIPPRGIRGVAFVVLRQVNDVETSARLIRYHVASKTGLSLPKKKNIATPDQMTVLEAEVVARSMSKFRPKGWGGAMVMSDTDDSVALATKSYFDILGITDIEKFDPRDRWRRNGKDSNLRVPLGFKHDGKNALDQLVMLDLAEAAQGGTGPHGVFQGVTGSGKSFLLTGFVLTLATYFGPDKLNMILMDFKGGSTFPGFEILPHVVANITNLDNEIELVARLGDVVDGEINRREQWLKDHDARDIVEYRKMSLRDPEAHPPMADLVLIADEFREFMQEHKNYLTLFTRIGAVGRSLGIHILPCSQYIDSTLLRELMEHLTFGVSLRASSDNFSRVVIGTPEAAKLPLGGGQAIIKQTSLEQGEFTTRFVGFDTEERYVPRRKAEAVAEELPDNVKLVEAFHISNIFSDELADKASKSPQSAPVKRSEDFPKDQQMKRVLLQHLSKFRDTTALQLWQPTLRAPISYADVSVMQASSPKLHFHIGDIDAPRQHTRLPYIISPESGNEHILIQGRGHSGRSTAVQAMVCSSGIAYPARYVSWCMIDYGGTKLGEIADMPNVSGYATKADTDKINRFLGEVTRIRNLREAAFTERRVSSLDAYLQSRIEDPIPDDPYGHLFFVIDGYTSFIEDYENAAPQVARLLDGGGRYGIHVVITAEKEMKLFNIINYFGSRIYLKVDDPNDLGNLARESREAIRLIPVDQPGRALDHVTGLSARILVPQYDRIEPVGIDPKSQMPVFDSNADYSNGIRAFAANMRLAYSDPSQLANSIDTVPAVIDYPILWSIYDSHKPWVDPATWEAGRRRALDVHHPFGISAEDLTMVTVPDTLSPHLMILGDPQSGKSMSLRSAMNSIVRQFGPDEAQIIIVDSKLEFLPEKELLDDMGFLMAYANDDESLSRAMSMLSEEITPRIPSLDQDLSMAAIRDRSWYSGPEIFLFLDDTLMFVSSATMGTGTGKTKTGAEVLVEIANGRVDLGLHIYATGPAQGFGTTNQTNKLYQALIQKNTPMMLLSGPPKEGPLPGKLKFANRRAGMGIVFTPENEASELIQLGRSLSWELPEGAPPQDVIDRARAIKAEILANRPQVKAPEQMTWFDAIGISDLDVYDPRIRWRENASSSNFEVPLGLKHDGHRLLNELVMLDIGEASQRGSGPHGALQGVTGSGKSSMLNSYVLNLATYFGPDKLNLILMDFKGGATFTDYEKLPHTVASITNLESEVELVGRMGDVIEGEIIRREELIRKYEAKDIVGYRKLHTKDPDKYPPLPDLVLIADEFKEFMVSHKEYLTLFGRIGAVGRSLGIHILPCSQYIDATLLRDLMEHLTFGISLKASTAAYSKTVIGTDDAANLVLGSWQAYVRLTDKQQQEQLYRFVSFNSEERYLPGGRGDLHMYPKDVAREDTMKSRLIDRLSQYHEQPIFQMWQPTLKAPVTYADITVEPATSSKLEFNIGVIDAPKKHARLPYVISPESGNEHILLIGRGHSGVSTAIEAMATSSAQAYSPRYVSWYLIDYGGTKLSEISSLPNVGAYATKVEQEKVERIIAEVIRIRTLREEEFTKRKVATMDAYLESRANDPVQDDPYGHIFLTIDGYNSYLADHEEAKNRMLRILDGGGRYGLHFVASVTDEVKLGQQAQFFGSKIIFKVEDTSTLMNVTTEVKEANKLIPKDQPGRVVVPSSGLSARILVPQLMSPEPEGIDSVGQPVYAENIDYSAGILSLADELRTRYPEAGQRAPVIETAAAVIDYSKVWEGFIASRALVDTSLRVPGRRPILDEKIVLGISAESLKPVVLNDKVSPHLIVLGDSKTGRTGTLRTVINSIIRQFDPTQAQIVIAETRYELLPEREMLTDMGYLLGYAENDAELTKIISTVDKMIRPRTPTVGGRLSMDTIRNRDWYTGPEVFVLIDNMDNFARGISGGMMMSDKTGIDMLVELVKLRKDLGLNVVLTGNAQKFAATMTMNKLCESLMETNTTIAMLSGPVTEPALAPGIKFRHRKPGEALVYSPGDGTSEVVQLAHSQTWELPEGAPSEDVVTRAESVKSKVAELLPTPPVEVVESSSDKTTSGGRHASGDSGSEPSGKRKVSGMKWGMPPK